MPFIISTPLQSVHRYSQYTAIVAIVVYIYGSQDNDLGIRVPIQPFTTSLRYKSKGGESVSAYKPAPFFFITIASETAWCLQL